MLAKRIIPCLDVKDGQIVKGTQFKNHRIIGDIVEYAEYYSQQGADELVFYHITASSSGQTTDQAWITRIAKIIDIPFCVAGGIRSVAQASTVLAAGADKISINSPALENPQLIEQLAKEFGSQCVVVGIDSYQQGKHYQVYQYTGDPNTVRPTTRETLAWAKEAQERGAGEIVLNCMNQDGVRQGYDLVQLALLRKILQIPLIASGGAGALAHFSSVFKATDVDGALAASVFHSKEITIQALKTFLQTEGIIVRN